MLIALCIYLWLLLAVAVAWFADQIGSPYSRTELFVRSLALPVALPVLIIRTLITRKA